MKQNCGFNYFSSIFKKSVAEDTCCRTWEHGRPLAAGVLLKPQTPCVLLLRKNLKKYMNRIQFKICRNDTNESMVNNINRALNTVRKKSEQGVVILSTPPFRPEIAHFATFSGGLPQLLHSDPVACGVWVEALPPTQFGVFVYTAPLSRPEDLGSRCMQRSGRAWVGSCCWPQECNSSRRP